MGIADGSHGEPVDCSVGTIVWVRRRNGSWWPGKILGPNELSSSHLMSPRSGTPVKLLGRDDASVDWYNLEKSRRVKAFRCGEFDDCIEKAESSQCIPIKKREKYARREDAILHALELEKLHLEHKWDKLGTTANFTSEKTSFLSRKQFPSDNSKSQSLPKRPDSTVEENSMGSLLYIQKTKQANKPDWEDDNFESVPRMRGLQDFGLKTAPSKRKLAPSIACDSSQKSVLPENHVNCSKISMPIKRKQLQGGLLEESLVKRRDRSRPLVQVLQSSAKLPECRALQTDGDVSISYALPNDCLAMRMPQCQFGIVNHVLHPGSSTEDIACSDLIEEENDFSEGDFLNPDSEEERAILSGSRNSGSYMGGNGLIFQAQQQAANMDSKELNEHGISSYPSQLYPHDQNADISADMGVSKWQLKRKRNIRNLTKRPMELMDRNKCNGSMLEASFNAKGNAAKMQIGISIQQPLHQVFHHRSVRELNYACRRDEDDITSSDNDSQAMSLSETDQFSNLPSSPNSEGCLFSQSSLRRYWEDSDQDVDPLRFYPSGYREADGGDSMESMLIDVNLKVQASYQGERVPLVSLMSRLNGKAIIGHPVQIEVLDEGSTNLLISESNCHGSPADRNGSPGLPPAWCTARRTAMQRVPRPRLSEDEEWGPNQHHVENNQNLLKKMRANRFKHKMRLVRKSSHVLRPLMNKLSRKIVKKTNLPNQKTRTLSSFAVERKFSGKIGNSDGLVKPEKTIPITCVPVKLIFSRILEAVGR